MTRVLPQQIDSEVLDLDRVGDYYHLTLAAPTAAALVRPGHFVAVAVGGPDTSMLLRRAFSIYRADARAGTIEVIFAIHGKGTTWLSRAQRGDPLNIVAPLGTPFSVPNAPVPCVLVAGGYGAAPMFELGRLLRERGCRVDMVLGAATETRLFGALEARRAADAVVVTTVDGSAGRRGLVTDPLRDILVQQRSAVVYACGPMGMLQAVSELATQFNAHSQCAVEESMACGVGVCMTCVLPVIGEDGVIRMVRSCVDGPVFFGDRVRWSEVGTVPADTLGAPIPGGH
ncbi:MAG: dihydroorotate dehydrogenase electron transfer subunit [Candidatus Nanopelagicales bacterium]